MRRDLAEEQGATMVLFAISAVALLSLIGIALDGGAAFASRRQQQNSADAGAMAATRELEEHLRGGDAGDILPAAINAATANDSDASSVTCTLVDANQSELGPCPTTSGGPIPANALGVRVTLSRQDETKFIKIVGNDSITVAAGATAQVQALRGGRSPFLLCAAQGGSNEFPATPILLDPNGDQNYEDYTINPAALTTAPYRLHGPQVKGCELKANKFKGLADDEAFSLPGPWGGNNGVKAGPTRVKVAGPDACGSETVVGCRLLIPLCTPLSYAPDVDTSAEDDQTLYCWTMGLFEITEAGANKETGKFLGAGIASSGQGGGTPLPNEARLIKLSE